jgi:hypothetical protein
MARHMGSLRAAREFHEGYLGEEHRGYMDQLRHLGVLASEMEGAHMFVLGAAHSHNADSLHGHDHVGAAAPSPIMSVATSRTGGSGTPCAAAEEVLMGTHPTPTRPPARTHARAAWLGSCVCVCSCAHPRILRHPQCRDPKRCDRLRVRDCRGFRWQGDGRSLC